MVLDLVTYLCMMTVFGGVVLLNDDVRLNWADVVFALYIFVSPREINFGIFLSVDTVLFALRQPADRRVCGGRHVHGVEPSRTKGAADSKNFPSS